MAEINGFTYAKDKTEANKNSEIDWTFHLQGFLNTTFKREIAE